MTSEASPPSAEHSAEGEQASQAPTVRYSASVSVPPTPAGSPLPPAPAASPASPAAPMPAGFPSIPVTGQARIAGSASVPQPPSSTPTTYGSPPKPYSPAPTAQTYPAQSYQAAALPPPAQQGAAQHNPAQHNPYQPYPPAPAGYGAPPQPAPNTAYSSASHASGAAPIGQTYPTQPFPASGDGRREAALTPTGGWPYVEQPAPAGPQKSRRLLVTLLIVFGAVILLAIAGVIGWAVTHRGGGYEVGACVKQDGGGARVVACDTAGAYTIISLVESEDQCPDPTQPSVILTGGGKGRQVACLKPVG